MRFQSSLGLPQRGDPVLWLEGRGGADASDHRWRAIHLRTVASAAEPVGCVAFDISPGRSCKPWCRWQQPGRRGRCWPEGAAVRWQRQPHCRWHTCRYSARSDEPRGWGDKSPDGEWQHRGKPGSSGNAGRWSARPLLMQEGPVEGCCRRFCPGAKGTVEIRGQT